MLVCSKKENLIDFSVNFGVLFYLSSEGLLTYEYDETLESINHAELCFEKKKSIPYANKSYSTHVSFHIFMDSLVHLKSFNTLHNRNFLFSIFSNKY